MYFKSFLPKNIYSIGVVALCATLIVFINIFLLVANAKADEVNAETVDSESSEQAIAFLQEKNFILSNTDLRLHDSVNRAEFIKLVVIMSKIDPKGRNCFEDVNTQWFAPYVCSAKEAGIISKNPHFRPADELQLAEAIKILALAFDVNLLESKSSEWFMPYIETFSALNYIPPSLDYFSETLTREEAFEMLWRVDQKIQTKQATKTSEFKGNSCQSEITGYEDYANIDMQKVKNTWLEWTNAMRFEDGLKAYVFNQTLDQTAYNWSKESRAKGSMTHKRQGQTAYYDYNLMQKWFKNQGVSFESEDGYTFTENIGYGPYSCNKADCTDDLIQAIHYTFDYFKSEKNQTYRPHYNSIMNSAFDFIGFGLLLDSNEYYLTIHYGTSLKSQIAFCD